MKDIIQSIYEGHAKFVDIGGDYSRDPRLMHLGRLVRTNQRVLDLGCSIGITTAHIRDCGNEVVGVDVAEPFLEACRSKGIECYSCNIEVDPFPEIGTFDVIVMTEFLEHLLDPLLALRRVRTLLRPSGRLVVSTINCAYIRYRSALVQGRLPDFGENTQMNDPVRLYNLHDKSLFTIDTFLRTVDAAGFRVLTFEPVMTDPAGFWRLPVLRKLRTGLQRGVPTLFASDVIAVTQMVD